jgi:DNA-directed RNA polymerase specialized sigma24 family protein
VMKTYRVVVTREGDSWLADVPDVGGTHTWAKNLPALDRHVREAIALAEDLPEGAEEGLPLAYEYSIGDPELDKLTAELRVERERVQRAERELAERTAQAAALLSARGLPMRDAAALLRVSYQRIAQVAPSRKKPNPAA